VGDARDETFDLVVEKKNLNVMDAFMASTWKEGQEAITSTGH
jgi:hypothetical protein